MALIFLIIAGIAASFGAALAIGERDDRGGRPVRPPPLPGVTPPPTPSGVLLLIAFFAAVLWAIFNALAAHENDLVRGHLRDFQRLRDELLRSGICCAGCFADPFITREPCGPI
ncbi:MAG: hypothetical protein HY909_13375 [Deltaproteobacteria bacterium]|nr:hypothetical protein [Deltaproteobacteria bacterium]